MIYDSVNTRSFVLERVSQPDIEPITLAQAKRHILQFSGVTTEDDDIEQWIQVAREWVEDYTGRAMIDQTWRLTVQAIGQQLSGDLVRGFTGSGYFAGNFLFDKGGVLLRRSPVLAITDFVTVDALGAETAVDASTYELRYQDSKYPRVLPVSGAVWPSNEFRIEFRAGFADRLGSPQQDSLQVPATLKHAMKLLLGNFDENRSSVVIGTISGELPFGIKALLTSQRCDLGMA